MASFFTYASGRDFEKALHGALVSDGFRTCISLGVARKTLSEIVNEHASVTPDMALRLSKAFQTTPELWLNMQRNYDLWKASHKSDDWKQVETIAV